MIEYRWKARVPCDECGVLSFRIVDGVPLHTLCEAVRRQRETEVQD